MERDYKITLNVQKEKVNMLNTTFTGMYKYFKTNATCRFFSKNGIAY